MFKKSEIPSELTEVHRLMSEDERYRALLILRTNAPDGLSYDWDYGTRSLTLSIKSQSAHAQSIAKVSDTQLELPFDQPYTTTKI